MAAPTTKAPRATEQNMQAAQTTQSCGSAGSAFGAACAALGVNVAIGLISGIVATLAAATAGPPGTRDPQRLAEGAKRGLIAGATVHGAITTGIGLMTAESHPHFGGAVTYIGVSALGTAVLSTMIPVEAIARIESANLPSERDVGLPMGGVQGGIPDLSVTPTPIDTISPARGLPMYGGPAIDPLRLAGAPIVRRTPIDAILPRR